MWLATDSKEFEAIEELEQGASERNLGVVAGAIVDSKLSHVLRRALGDDSPYSKKVRAELFNPDGPLGSFGSRISMAFLLGLLTEKGHTDLQTFKKIRNLFAHYAEHGTFASQRIRDLCRNLLLVDERVSEQLIVRRNVGDDGISK
jgi:DNA-binding MltR family transcriptional regulator